MQDVRNRLVDEAKTFGIEIVDVRIKRVDFVADITDSVYRRMESELKPGRQRVACAGHRRAHQAPTRTSSAR